MLGYSVGSIPGSAMHLFTLNLGGSTSLVWALFILEKGDNGFKKKKQAQVSFVVGKVAQM